MKMILFCILMICATAFAEKNLNSRPIITVKDSSQAASIDSSLSDSINISKMVKSQFEAAMTGVVKSSINYQAPNKVVDPGLKLKPLIKGPDYSFPGNIIFILNNFNYKYTNVAIFIISSAGILLFIFARRYFKKKYGKPGKQLKRNIESIRQEKPVLVKNKKLQLIRNRLSESADLYNISDSSISGKAKEMKVGKGEIVLAAKLKAFQLSIHLERTK